MTIEELKKEAEEYANNIDYTTTVKMIDCVHYHENCDVADMIAEAYLVGSEPREKRIAELEQQIEKMKCCGNCKFGCIACGNYLCELLLNNCNSIPFHCDKWEIKEE